MNVHFENPKILQRDCEFIADQDGTIFLRVTVGLRLKTLSRY